MCLVVVGAAMILLLLLVLVLVVREVLVWVLETVTEITKGAAIIPSRTATYCVPYIGTRATSTRPPPFAWGGQEIEGGRKERIAVAGTAASSAHDWSMNEAWTRPPC